MERDFQNVQHGTTVYDRDGTNLGTVADVAQNYLLVQKGFFFTTDRYIPFSAIARVEQDGIYVNASRDELDTLGWDQPPTDETAFASTTSTSSTTTVQDDIRPSAGFTTGSTGTTGDLDAGSTTAIPIVEEELRVGKREVETGGVRVTTRVEEVPVNEQVTLRDETVDVHRRAVDRPVTDADLATLQSGSFEVRERDEEAIVDKQARVVEEVHVKKTVQDRTETVQDTVRRTDVDIENIQGGTRASSTETVGQIGPHGVTGRDVSATGDEGTIERGGSTLGNAAERATNTDLDRDGDVGQRDPRNNY